MLFSLPLPSLDTSHTVFQLPCFRTPSSGLCTAPFTWHPFAGAPCSIPQQLPMLFSLLCCPDYCYLFDFCRAPSPLLRPLVIPAVSALPLRELPFLLLPTVHIKHWNFFDFQVLYFSAYLAARVLSKYCCTVDFSTVYGTGFHQLLSEAGKGDHAQNCSLRRQEAWDVEPKPSCRWDIPGLDAYQQVKTGMGTEFYLLIKSAGIWQ